MQWYAAQYHEVNFPLYVPGARGRPGPLTSVPWNVGIFTEMYDLLQPYMLHLFRKRRRMSGWCLISSGASICFLHPKFRTSTSRMEKGIFYQAAHWMHRSSLRNTCIYFLKAALSRFYATIAYLSSGSVKRFYDDFHIFSDRTAQSRLSVQSLILYGNP